MVGFVLVAGDPVVLSRGWLYGSSNLLLCWRLSTLLQDHPEIIERAFFRCYPLKTLQVLRVPPSFQQ